MAKTALSPLYKQLARVHRRLLLQSLVNALIWFWAGAILLAAAWFIAQPLLLQQPPQWLRWVVAGGLVGAGTMAAVVCGALWAPSRLAAALSLDSEFGLKERVTTSLTLPPDQESTPAGQALLADVNQKITDLDVGSRFPVRMSWSAALVPVCAAVLAMVALFYEPTRGSATSKPTNDLTKPPPNLAEIEQKMKDLKRTREKPAAEKLKSEELEKLEAELEKIANKPRKTKEDIKERVKEMTALEDQMKGLEREMAEKAKSLQNSLKQLDKNAGKDSEEGPAKDLQKALAEGKLDKAKEELERISKRLKNNEMTDKEKEQLRKQMEKMQQKMERLAQQKDKKEQLQKSNLDPETLQREMEDLQKQSQKLKDLQDLANEMSKCKECLKQGDSQSAMESLKKAGDKLKEMQGREEDLADLEEQLKSLKDAKGSCCQGLGEKEEEGEPRDSDLDQDTENGGIGQGKRPLGKEKPFRSFDSKAKAEFDPKGKKIFDGYAPGQGFRKKTGPEFAEDIRQASQEAPEAIEQQRVPKAARDMMRGYFDKMRQQAEKDLKKTDKP
jgi:hypothetical protein